MIEISTKDLIRQLIEENCQLRNQVDEITNTLAMKKEIIQQLKDEIAELKGQKPKPKIRPSKLEGQKSKNWKNRIRPNDKLKGTISFSKCFKALGSASTAIFNYSFSKVSAESALSLRLMEISKLARQIIKKVRMAAKPGQPQGKPRKKKKNHLVIHEKPIIQPENVPDEAVFKGYNRYTVQDLIIKPYNIQYHMARWQLPDGSYIAGELPKEIQGHYGPELITHILYQYYTCRVTEHLLLEQLRAHGMLISAGQLNNILIENKDYLIKEVKELLPAAAHVCKQLQADDTGGRHKGQNQYTTVIGNHLCSVFSTTSSKSRINFLKLLQNGQEEYLINEDTLDYLYCVKSPHHLFGCISLKNGKKITNLEEWNDFLRNNNITKKNEVRFVTEAALYASVIQKGVPKDLDIHSDDAGQFSVFIHSLCWIHEERHYRKLIMTTDKAKSELEHIENQIWTLYKKLKEYKENPINDSKRYLEEQFDNIFQQKTSSPTLNHQLSKTYAKKEKLLRVLENPNTPLHNNVSETDERAAKIKLKISGGTRSETGKKARDTFLSLQQTCKKLNINFIDFLRDRVRWQYKIPRLATIIYQRVVESLRDPPLIEDILHPIQNELS